MSRQLLRALGVAFVVALAWLGVPSAAPAAATFPARDSAYHDYAEMAAQVERRASEHPALVRRFSLGRSHQGRRLWAVKISDNAAIDEPEPEVLLVAGQHAREHLTVELALYLLDELTMGYATDPRVRAAVDGRETWIVFNANPDGSQFDIAGGRYHGWRKNRQPSRGGRGVGTDLNRNWSWKWGCCQGSSGRPRSDEYRGASAFSAPETRRLRDFVRSRVVGGRQQIRAAIDFHAYSELVLWPYGHTRADTASRLSAEDRAAFVALGRRLAAANRYTPQQQSELYVADGTLSDWLWAAHGIFAFTFELYPRAMNPGFYPPDEVIPEETSRNREAVLLLLEHADCPRRAAGASLTACPDATRAPSAFSAGVPRVPAWAPAGRTPDS